MGEFERVFRDWERERSEALRPMIAAARNERKIAEATLDVLQRKAAKLEGDARQQLCEQAEQLAKTLDASVVPISPRLLADDATAEVLARLLASHDGRMGVLSAEGGSFDLMAGRYRSNKQSGNLDVYLKAHAGDTIRIDRVSRASDFIERPAVTFGLLVQPEVVAGLASHSGFRGLGLLARFLYSLPPSLIGKRKVRPPVPPGVRSSSAPN